MFSLNCNPVVLLKNVQAARNYNVEGKADGKMYSNIFIFNFLIESIS